ncbi:hypothetical protein BN11_4430002 [Nostocoides australiense Ben110]|uniref:DUF488 domain-containing protein n=1 Tax=Nostocoides australiense Ben110 TaxID=1193182 RepID=W6K0C8_9MICO|nr:hypothetical protein BN11_4430002 [Tetrasphaera australiensis Ben110]
MPSRSGTLNCRKSKYPVAGQALPYFHTQDTPITDARSRLTPLSRKQGFSKGRLRTALGNAGVRYEHLRPLGNARENRPLFAGAEVQVGRARYRAGLRTPEARAALIELASWRQEHHVALLCFEKDEKRCHRAVVLEELAQLG